MQPELVHVGNHPSVHWFGGAEDPSSVLPWGPESHRGHPRVRLWLLLPQLVEHYAKVIIMDIA